MADVVNALVEKFSFPDWAKTLVDHNRYAFLAAALVAALFVGVGCDILVPKGVSPISGQRVTAAQLDAEVTQATTQKNVAIKATVAKAQAQIDAIKADVDSAAAMEKADVDALTAKAQAAYDDIGRQATMIQSGIQAISGLTGSIPGPWGAVVSLTLGAATAGLGLDNLRKSSVIADHKAAAALPAAAAVSTVSVPAMPATSDKATG